jgi:hypothetical protein
VGFVALGQVFPRVLRFIPVNFIPPVLHYKEKRRKTIIFITGLLNKPQGCGASVAPAAGPFTTKENPLHVVNNMSLLLLADIFYKNGIVTPRKYTWK